jgi:hypothetical protein
LDGFCHRRFAARPNVLLPVQVRINAFAAACDWTGANVSQLVCWRTLDGYFLRDYWNANEDK